MAWPATSWRATWSRSSTPASRCCRFVREADVGVLMSNEAQHREGCSNAIMEYMACRLPVVCSPGGGNPELVLEGETGFLVPAGDREALAGRLRDAGRRSRAWPGAWATPAGRAWRVTSRSSASSAASSGSTGRRCREGLPHQLPVLRLQRPRALPVRRQGAARGARARGDPVLGALQPQRADALGRLLRAADRRRRRGPLPPALVEREQRAPRPGAGLLLARGARRAGAPAARRAARRGLRAALHAQALAGGAHGAARGRRAHGRALQRLRHGVPAGAHGAQRPHLRDLRAPRPVAERALPLRAGLARRLGRERGGDGVGSPQRLLRASSTRSWRRAGSWSTR